MVGGGGVGSGVPRGATGAMAPLKVQMIFVSEL